MLLPLTLLTSWAMADPPVYRGREGEIAVQPPRIEAAIDVDGRLDEAAWQEAARLTRFSQFSPVDGIEAVDSTEVLVWYSPTAIHFGVRAFEAHGAANATLADRDRIFADDYVQIFLSTFNDGRQANVFAVNPLGIQADGALVETGKVSGNGFNNATATREAVDLSPNYVFESKGRLTEWGYEVEIRIPFKSLRYQHAREQSWGINVLRRVQHSGFEDTWTPARRASASFLTQSGRLEGLTELRRGVVLDLNPEFTGRVAGARLLPSGRYDYGSDGDVGGNVRWGITNNLTLNGTVNPDFSQVESDAGQFAFDPRESLFFPERRPFFLEGIEQFSTPNSLIYTRRVVQPVAATKLGGKAFGTDVAFLSAVDDKIASRTGEDHPFVNLLRVQRDVGKRSRLGIAYTDRIDGKAYNRVADVDGRFVFGGIYAAQFQFAGSRTRVNGVTTDAPLWDLRFNRSGRAFGWRYAFSGISDKFVAGNGFIPRRDMVHAFINHRITLFGKPDGFLQNFTGDVTLDGIWRYDDFGHGRESLERKLHFNTNYTLRGGWKLGFSVLVESFGMDPSIYSGYAIEQTTSAGVDTVPFVGVPRLYNLDYVFSLDTPEFQTFSANVFALWGKDENFDEWSSGQILIGNAGLTWRPTSKIRVEGTYDIQRVARRTDGKQVNLRQVPRVKLEYQISRPLFVRVIGQYLGEKRAALRDDSRTNAPLLIYDDELQRLVRADARESNQLHGDLLIAYQPTPGTVAFLGYGSTLAEPDALRRPGYRRDGDALFAKMSYLFRM